MIFAYLPVVELKNTRRASLKGGIGHSHTSWRQRGPGRRSRRAVKAAATSRCERGGEHSISHVSLSLSSRVTSHTASLVAPPDALRRQKFSCLKKWWIPLVAPRIFHSIWRSTFSLAFVALLRHENTCVPQYLPQNAGAEFLNAVDARH